MAASQPTFGIRHLTVVPTNFEPPVDDEDETEAEAEAETDQ